MSTDTFWKREYFVVVSQKMFDSSCLKTRSLLFCEALYNCNYRSITTSSSHVQSQQLPPCSITTSSSHIQLQHLPLTRTGNISDDSIKTKLYDKRDEINLPIMNSPFLYHNIPTAPAYGVNRSIRSKTTDK
jgi:hypothetical protein